MLEKKPVEKVGKKYNEGEKDAGRGRGGDKKRDKNATKTKMGHVPSEREALEKCKRKRSAKTCNTKLLHGRGWAGRRGTNRSRVPRVGSRVKLENAGENQSKLNFN